MFQRMLQFVPFALAFLLFALVGSVAHAQVQQQVFHNSDVSVSAFGQFSTTTSGNGISQRTTRSGGGRAAFRHSYHWWLGYEAGYGYTRYADDYTGQPFGYQHNMHEFSGTYLVHGPSALGFEPFGGVGASALIFSPSLNGGQHAAWQGRPAINFSFGISRPIRSSSPIGIRLQYRGLFYKAPDFGQSELTTNGFRLTSEPTVGFYVKF